jgi:hypothetical protein
MNAKNIIIYLNRQFAMVYSFTKITALHGMAAVGGGLTVCSYVLRELTPITLDRSSGRDPVGRSSTKGGSRLARPPRTSHATGGTKREYNWGLEERVRAKEIKA